MRKVTADLADVLPVMCDADNWRGPVHGGWGDWSWNFRWGATPQDGAAVVAHRRDGVTVLWNVKVSKAPSKSAIVKAVERACR